MEYTAQWGPKGFIVSPTKFVSFDDFSASFSLKSDSNTDTSGTSQSNSKSMEPQKIALATTYVRAAGVDPRGQIEEWQSLLGKYHPLYIGGKRFGPKYLQLKKVDVSDLLIDNNGLFLQVTVTIALEEITVAEKKTTGNVYTGPTTTTDTVQRAETIKDMDLSSVPQLSGGSFVNLYQMQSPAMRSSDPASKMQQNISALGSSVAALVGGVFGTVDPVIKEDFVKAATNVKNEASKRAIVQGFVNRGAL